MSVFPGPVAEPAPVPLTLRRSPPVATAVRTVPPVPPSGWDVPTGMADPDGLPLNAQERAAVGHAVRAGLIEPERAGGLRADRADQADRDRPGLGRRDAG